MSLSQSITTKINALRAAYPTNQALLIPLLHEIQEERGWVSMDSQKEAAAFLELPLTKVREVVTFYTMFNQEPVGKVNLQLCVNLSCWLNGSDKLKACMEKRLGIECGETTKDGKYTLMGVECLASCGTAPVLQVNEDYYENLSVPELTKLLDQVDRDLVSGKNVGISTRAGV